MAKACGAAGRASRMRPVTAVESTPPESSEPTGTSDMSWRRTAFPRPVRIASSHSSGLAGSVAGAKRGVNERKAGGPAGASRGMEQ